MRRDIIIIGGGEHSKVILNSIYLKKNEWNILGLVDDIKPDNNVIWLGSDEIFLNKIHEFPFARFIIGVGSVENRKKITDKYEKIINSFCTVIHPSAVVANNIEIDSGVFISANAVIQPGVRINKHVIINTGAIIEHDCRIGENSHIAPGAIMGGGCNIGNNCLIGIGVSIKDHITIGNNVTVGAGAVVVNDIEDDYTVVGIPAKPIKAYSMQQTLKS